MSNAQSHQRYTLKSLIPATLTYKQDGARHEVLLENLSAGGAGLTLYQEPRAGEAVTLEFRLAGEDVSIAAELKWGRPSGQKEWSAGCHFRKPLRSTALLETDSAEPERVALSCKALMRRECAPDYPFTVEIRNSSSGGIGIVAREQFTAGERVILEVPGPAGDEQFVVRLQWADVSGDESLMGCRFEHDYDATRFRELTGMGACGRDRQKETQALWLAAAVAIATVTGVLWWTGFGI